MNGKFGTVQELQAHPSVRMHRVFQFGRLDAMKSPYREKIGN